MRRRRANRISAVITPIQPAMERHAAFPDFEDADRVGKIFGRLIEQTMPTRPPISTPAIAQNRKSSRSTAVGRLSGPLKRFLPRQPYGIAPAQDQPCDIGQPVPAYRQRADLERDRV